MRDALKNLTKLNAYIILARPQRRGKAENLCASVSR